MRAVPRLETERLVVTLPDPEAGAAMARYIEENLAHLTPWSPALPVDFRTASYWKLQLQRHREEFAQGSSLRLVISRREAPSGAIVGVCNFTQMARGPFLACYLGYSLDHRQQGRGMMREALEAALAYVFDELRLHRVMANYMPTNERSGALLRRLGFVVEGYARDYLYLNGAWRDHVLTAKTSPHPEDPSAHDRDSVSKVR